MMKISVFLLITTSYLCSCNKDKNSIINDFNNQKGQIIVNCSTRGSYQYLISVKNSKGETEIYYPSNLPQIFKSTINDRLPIIFSAAIKDSLEQIYKPAPNDIPVPAFKAKVIYVAKIDGEYSKITILGDFGKCFPISKFSSSGYVLIDSKSYADLQDTIRVDYFDECNSTDLPTIDFSQFSLIGIATDAQCSATYDRKEFIDIENKKCVYSIIVNQNGLCKLLVQSMNWAIVPKIPNDYTVEFRTIKKNE
jgi:hypothetical protein